MTSVHLVLVRCCVVTLTGSSFSRHLLTRFHLCPKLPVSQSAMFYDKNSKTVPKIYVATFLYHDKNLSENIFCTLVFIIFPGKWHKLALCELIKSKVSREGIMAEDQRSLPELIVIVVFMME